MRRISFLLVALMVAQSAAAQVNPATPRIPEITAAGRGEVPITPDRATILVSVETRAPSAAAAATENSDKIARVLDALRRSGLAQSDITTAAYTVGEDPRNMMRMMSPTAPVPAARPTEFLARNSVRANVRRPSDVGKIIDAALAAGATSIASVQFSSPTTDDARRQAIAIAVAQAQRDADAIARAAGGTLGRLLSMSSSQMPVPYDYMPSDTYFTAVAGGSAVYPTMINPRDLTVVVSVFGRWEFVPGAR